MTDDEKRMQVADQCRAVAALATTLAQLHTDYAEIFGTGKMDKLLDMVGARTAGLMETIGDFLNGMDAVSEDDAWMDPIFEQAQRFWPQPDAN